MSRKPASRQKIRGDLTALEVKFVANLVGGMNGKDALKAAGSTADDRWLAQQAHEMRQKPHIAKAILNAVSLQEEKAIVNKTWVMTELVTVYKAAIRAGERSNALKALEKIGNHVDVNAFRHQIGLSNPDGSNLLDFSGLTDDELDQLEPLLAKAARGTGGGGEPYPAPGGEGTAIQ